MLDPNLMSFVLGSLPPPPANVLEVGAGEGELAGALASAGYEVVAIDPESKSDTVRPIRLHELDAASSFDAAVAVLSMHHVEPLDESCQRLGEAVRSGGTLVLDEIDFELFDERAAGWWLEQGGTPEHDESSPAEIVAHLRHHCHMLRDVEAALDQWFELGRRARGPYLYRWDLAPALRATELDLIARGELPPTGARIVGRRR